MSEYLRTAYAQESVREAEPPITEVVDAPRQNKFVNALPEHMRQKSLRWHVLGDVVDAWRNRWEAQINDLRTRQNFLEPANIKMLVTERGHSYESDLTPYAATALSMPSQLAYWSAVSGTDKWINFVSFLFGAEVAMHPLFTRDYVTFFRKPYGNLVKNGGDWYQTTHVDIDIDVRALQANLLPRASQTLQDCAVEVINKYKPITYRINKVQIKNTSVLEVGSTVVKRSASVMRLIERKSQLQQRLPFE